MLSGINNINSYRKGKTKMKWDASTPRQKLDKILKNSYFKQSLSNHGVSIANINIIAKHTDKLLHNMSCIPTKSQYINLVAALVISPISNIEKSFNYIMAIHGRFSGVLYDRWCIMYGVEYANTKLDNLNTKLSNRKVIKGKDKRYSTVFCIEYWIKNGYTEKESLEKVKEVQSKNAKKRSAASYNNMENYSNRSEYWVKKGYTPEESKQLTIDQIKKQSRSLEGFVYRHGLEKGASLYNKSIIKFKESMRDENGIWKGTCYTSKESARFFMPIYKYLRKIGIERSEIYWGIHSSKEYYINKGNGDIFRYDFTIPRLKIIIEYHGIAWHPISIEDDGVFRYIGEFFGKNREDAYLKDKYKEEVARDNGFKIFSVWSIETNKEYKVLKFIEESINEQ
jgi:hypothetical protein